MRKLIFVLVVAAGCGKSDSKQSPAPSTTAPTGSAAAADPAPAAPTAPAAAADPATTGACALLTAAEASEIVGVPMKIVEPEENSCFWAWTEKTNEHHGISIEVKTYKDAGMFDTLAKRKSAKPVEGIGDRAVTDALGKQLVQLAFAKGSKSALINISDEKDNPDLAQKMNAIAAKVSSRL